MRTAGERLESRSAGDCSAVEDDLNIGLGPWDVYGGVLRLVVLRKDCEGRWGFWRGAIIGAGDRAVCMRWVMVRVSMLRLHALRITWVYDSLASFTSCAR